MEHVAILDADRHEPKHASTALAGQLLKSAGAGVTAFSFLNWSEVQNKPSVTGYASILRGQSVSATQAPSGLGVPLKVEFGPAQTTGDVTLSALGDLTFVTGGQYLITLFFRFGRTTGTGDAYLFNRLLLSGTQVLNSNALRLGSQEIVVPFSSNVLLTVTAGQVFSAEILRDSAGVNNGGLIQLTPSLAGWAPAPTATILVSKFVGLV
ncbi:hypothetical protein [Pseudomonas phage GP100]|nr:hypothetical protein [Pseudomonas phage GP100]